MGSSEIGEKERSCPHIVLTGTLHGHDRSHDLIRRKSQYPRQHVTNKKTKALAVKLFAQGHTATKWI